MDCKLSMLVALAAVFFGCSSNQNTDTDVYLRNLENVVDVKTQIKEIKTESLLLSGSIVPYSLGQYFALKDYKSPDNQIFIFDGDDYKYLASTGKLGQGPGEIISMGDLMWNQEKGEMYVPDFASYKIYGYRMDSVLVNPDYMPFEKSRMKSEMFPSNVTYLNDTLSYGRIIKPTSESTFDVYTGKWNLLTGDVETLQYRYPKLEKYRYMVAASTKSNVVVEANILYDLLTIMNLNGNLKCNIHGPNWKKGGDGNRHYVDVKMSGNYILASYDGNPYDDGVKPTQIRVFDSNCNYVKTLDVGYGISNFCIDETHNRLMLCLDDDLQLGYIDLDNTL